MIPVTSGMTANPDAKPAWFEWAIAQPSSSRYADSGGTPVHYVALNEADTGKPGLLFAHGYRGNRHWWDFIAPFFIDRFRVYALDFSGMGDSGHRASYDARVFADDLVAVIRHAGIAPATLVGHSYGGSRVFRACAEHSGLAAHAVIVDTYMHFIREDALRGRPPLGRPAPYPDYATARARYRLVPDQPAIDYLRDYLGVRALRQVPGGWTWKFDTKLPFAMLEDDAAAMLEEIAIPVDYVYGARSAVVDAPRAHRIVQHLRHARGPIAIPEAHHHVMLDQPIALIGTLRALLA